MTADDVEIRAELPWVGDLILAAELEAEIRNPGQVIAGNDVDVAVGVGIGIERRRQSQVIPERGIHVRVIGIKIPALPFVGRIGLDALTQRIPAVLKIFVPGNRTGDIDDVVGVERVVGAHGPVQLPFGDVEMPA